MAKQTVARPLVSSANLLVGACAITLTLTISHSISGVSALLVDDGARQAGFDELQKIADNSLAPALNSRVTGNITRARAAI